LRKDPPKEFNPSTTDLFFLSGWMRNNKKKASPRQPFSSLIKTKQSEYLAIFKKYSGHISRKEKFWLN